MNIGYSTEYAKGEIEQARQLGFDSMELSVGWFPDIAMVREFRAAMPEIKDSLAKTGIRVSTVACYANHFKNTLAESMEMFGLVSSIARELGTGVVATLTGRDGTKTIEANMPLLKDRWSELLKVIEDNGLKVAFEPWQGTPNEYGIFWRVKCAVSPHYWGMIFNELASDSVGVEYDAGHFLWQGIDYIQAIRDYPGRIFHVHAKDIIIDERKKQSRGVLGDGWWRSALPGLGSLDWKAIFGSLKEIGYSGAITIEQEDEMFQGPKRAEGLSRGLAFLREMLPGRRAP